jgi:hypothetical protein
MKKVENFCSRMNRPDVKRRPIRTVTECTNWATAASYKNKLGKNEIKTNFGF